MKFLDAERELLVITTVSNWDEPPRIRHEIAEQMSRFYNVLYVQVYCQRGKIRRRRQISDSLITERAGLCVPGIFRVIFLMPFLMWVYNYVISLSVERLVKRYGYTSAILCNFQFNLPQVHDRTVFRKSVYFCNEDFVNQNSGDSGFIRRVKRGVQLAVLRRASLVMTVSDPLNKMLSNAYPVDVHTILSGHNFDTEISKRFLCSGQQFGAGIRVCYLGFLSDAIAIDWLEEICGHDDMQLTIIGPISNPRLIDKLVGKNNFAHIETLVGESLQIELLKHDVLVMPYSSSVDNEVTSAPAKLFQYLATGRPVVSSFMPNLIEMPDYFVYKSKSACEFIQNIRQAASSDSIERKNNRIAFSEMHSWNARGDLVRKLLEE